MKPCDFSQQEIISIALREDPRIAAILSRPQPREYRLLTTQATFEKDYDPVVQNFIEVPLPRYITNDCIVLSTDYIIRADTFRKSVFGPQSAYFRTKGDTWIDVTLRIEGEDRRVLMNQPIPLEHVFGPDCAWTGPRVLIEGQQLVTTFFPRRDFIDQEDFSELPYQIIVTFKILQLGGCLWRQMTFQSAVDELLSKGINPWACKGGGEP
jgi:hypothetical protein